MRNKYYLTTNDTHVHTFSIALVQLVDNMMKYYIKNNINPVKKLTCVSFGQSYLHPTTKRNSCFWCYGEHHTFWSVRYYRIFRLYWKKKLSQTSFLGLNLYSRVCVFFSQSWQILISAFNEKRLIHFFLALFEKKINFL